MKTLLLVAACLAFCQGDVLDLTDTDFNNKIADHETVLVMFYAPWCGHCKRLKPEFEKAGPILESNDPPVMLAKVDCTEGGKDTCGKYDVSGYPTLKIFRNGELSSDYNGPREADGIIKFMKSQVGPSSKELKTLEEAEVFMNKNEVGVVYFGEGSSLKDAFIKVADKMRETVRFGHSTNDAINKKYGHDDAIVLFRPPVMKNKFEEGNVVYTGGADKTEIEAFIKENYHGIVGHRVPDNAQDFRSPLVVAYYSVDYVKNPKGTNYWRNRIIKVAQDFSSDFKFAVASKDDFTHEINEFGIDHVAGDKPQICARNAKDQKFVMKEEFTMDTFRAFLEQVKGGEVEPFLKSEPVPESQEGVIVAVGKNFDDVITNSGRDALIEFYAPWCGHCKKLVPVYDELAEALKDDDVDIVKMDATANDVPPQFTVKGFPTLFWRPKGGSPVAYNGGREVDDFIKFIAKEATEELKSYTRSGAKRKTEL